MGSFPEGSGVRLIVQVQRLSTLAELSPRVSLKVLLGFSRVSVRLVGNIVPELNNNSDTGGRVRLSGACFWKERICESSPDYKSHDNIINNPPTTKSNEKNCLRTSCVIWYLCSWTAWMVCYLFAPYVEFGDHPHTWEVMFGIEV